MRRSQIQQRVILPHNFTPRYYQAPLFKFVPSVFKRAVCVWHRRAGKDKTLFNLIIREAFLTPGIYYYFFPTYQQGRKILWDGIDKNGFKFLDHVPEAICKGKNATEMKITISTAKNSESIIQIIGTDNASSIRGTNPIGCVWSEYSFQDPSAWEVVKPIHSENKGWDVFNYTPNGPNHGQDLYEMALKDPSWFCQLLTVRDTKDEHGNPLVTDYDIQREREQGMSESMIQQEYYCSFLAAVMGSYFGEEVNWLRNNGRITKVPFDSNQYVDTWWDIGGASDPAALWFTQDAPDGVHLIDCHDILGAGIEHWASVLKERSDKSGYRYGRHGAPHDISVREVSANATSRIEIAKGYGINFEIVPRPTDKFNQSIEPARKFFKRCWFNGEKTEVARGLKALELYRRKYDNENKVLTITPLHDWTCHFADAFQTLALGHDRQSYEVRGGMDKVRRAFG